MDTEIILSSRQNSRIRYFRSLHDRKTAEREGVVTVEGVRLCEEAFKSGYMPRLLIYTNSKKTLVSEWSERFAFSENIEKMIVTEDLMAYAMSTVNPQGIAAVVDAPEMLGPIPIKGRDLYLITDGISDPGNLGTMIRTADAFAFSAVILSNSSVDPFNDKAIRASMGSCFHVPIIRVGSTADICLIIKRMGVQLIASHLDGNAIEDTRISFPAALVIGNEAWGISDECLRECDTIVKIPMPGSAESLNAASACSILSYVLTKTKEQGI